ncbi:MAG: hypothetical protein FWG65_08980 [Turicibacter sp.]|nr:hypothetical protein [Turicibacter sp.]
MHDGTGYKHPEFTNILTEIDRALADYGRVILAIDGDAAAGKTTLTGNLEQIYGCSVVHLDHFFLPRHLRTENRLDEPGGNIDYDRFTDEIIEPLLEMRDFSYRPFNCQTWDFGEEIPINLGKLTVLEGSYALHPKFVHIYNLKFFLKIESNEQMRRIKIRNPDKIDLFQNVWIPLEKKYQVAFEIDNPANSIVYTYREE